MSKSELLWAFLQKAALALPVFFFLMLFSGRAFASASDPRDSDSPYGVLDFLAWDHDWNSHHYTPEKAEKAVLLMKEAGVGFVRMDFLWNDIEPEKGRFDFEKYDRITDLLTRNGIKILAILHYTPEWTGKPWNTPPDPESYARYSEAVVHRYKDRIKYWEIWNEPDSAIYWEPQDDQKTYAELLKYVYPRLKKEDPTCQILMGSASQSPPALLRRLYQYGAKDSFDVVNVHPFANPLQGPGALKALKGMYSATMKVMQKNGDGDKPIWFTELGAPGVVEADSTNGWWMGKSPTEEQQARWVEAVYGEPLKWKGVKKIFWAFFRDTQDHFKNGIDSFGLLREDFSKKPSYEAYKKMATGKSPASKGN